MADGRMLKRAISDSRRLADLKSDAARLLYTWLIPWLDIEGRFSANPWVIKGKVVPRLKNFGIGKIESCLSELAASELINLYEFDGDRYLELRKFKDHQNLRPGKEAESQIPDPKKADSRPTPAQLPPKSGVREDKLREDKISKDKLDFDEIWKKYPNRDGKKEALRHFNASVKTEKDCLDINKALENYKAHLEVETWKKPKNGSTWFNNWRDWIDYEEPGWKDVKANRKKQALARIKYLQEVLKEDRNGIKGYLLTEKLVDSEKEADELLGET